jgi:uncharacterized protein (TIGR00661 family)
MARILYGVQGEGMGHATRSSAIIRELLKKHEVIIVSSDKAYQYLSNRYKRVYKIDKFDLVYRRGAVSLSLTIFKNLWEFPKVIKSIRRVKSLIKHINPNIVITDFEPYTNYAAKQMNLPLICIDNQHIITNTKIPVDKKYRFSYLITKIIIKLMADSADYFLVTTFFYPKIKDDNTLLFPPILREGILKAKTKKLNHILVYQTSRDYEHLIPILKQLKHEHFIIYHYSENLHEDNITYKQFSEKGFFEDFATAKALITNGGNTMIGEAIYLHKPILSVPLNRQFEQILNAHYVKHLGYGEKHSSITKDKIVKFLSNLRKYEKNLEKYKQNGNSLILSQLNILINNLKR